MSDFGEKVDDYEILEHLGKGGFAHVYRAKCRHTGQFVAIKMIDKALMARAGMIGRVRQEVTIHSRLKHPAILELFTFFEDTHYVYLVLELAHNGELAKHFKLGARGLPEKAAADILKQVVSGVLYLHMHNIIHRDLSLNNLLLTKDLTVKIADFGLATQLNGPDEKHVTMCGTPNYISPEVASRELHGLPADVWGLGCMLYTLLVGRPPFHTQHVKTTLNKVINADYTIPAELTPEAQDILLKLLCKDPIKRISLKDIMEHPFLNCNYVNICSTKQDISKDSGFLTTLHSTQHSSKLKNEEMFHFENQRYNTKDMVLEIPELRKPRSFNVFHENQQNCWNVLSALSHNSEKPVGVFEAKYNNGVSNIDSACGNSATDLTKNIDKRFTKIHVAPTNSIEENKENIQKPVSSNSSTLGVPPLCADRLPIITHKTRNAILKIETSGVVVEFIKRKGREREEKIVEICKISKDGMKIIIQTADRATFNQETLKTYNTYQDQVFTYHNLPQRHWKKYLYASRFVDIVKAKTPKITLYSTLAKCQLMENGTDIDVFFYNGEKVNFNSTDGLKVIDKCLRTHHEPLPLELKYLTDHFEECSKKINSVQVALSTIPDDCFPIIIGKRPIQISNNTAQQHGSIANNYATPDVNIGSFHRTAASSSHVPSDYT